MSDFKKAFMSVLRYRMNVAGADKEEVEDAEEKVYVPLQKEEIYELRKGLKDLEEERGRRFPVLRFLATEKELNEINFLER